MTDPIAERIRTGSPSSSLHPRRAPTLLVPRLLNSDSIAVWRPALEAGWEIAQVGESEFDSAPRTRDFCIFGPLSFGDAMRAVLPVALVEPADDWLCRLPPPFLKRSVAMMPMAEIRRLVTAGFVKPARKKDFPSGVYAGGCNTAAPESFPDHRSVIVAEPVTFLWEVRLFVLDRGIAAASPYSWRGKRPPIACPAETMDSALDFGRTLLDTRDVLIPPAIVIDVGFIERRGWAVVEANPAWACTLYSASPNKVLPVLRRASWNMESCSSDSS